MAIKVSKDKRHDVGYVQFKQGKVSKTVEIRPGILLDLDAKGAVLGLEVMSLMTLAPVLKYIKRTKTGSKTRAA